MASLGKYNRGLSWPAGQSRDPRPKRGGAKSARSARVPSPPARGRSGRSSVSVQTWSRCRATGRWLYEVVDDQRRATIDHLGDHDAVVAGEQVGWRDTLDGVGADAGLGFIEPL